MTKRAKSGFYWGLLAVVAAVQSAAVCTAEPETVTVEAQRQRQVIEQQISTYVSSITMPNREEALLRWHRAICPAVIGLADAQDDFVLARLSKAITEAGAPLAPENCAPNFLVLAGQQPEEILQKWWKHNPRLFNSDHGIGGIEHFLSGTIPIRAWYNAELGCTGGAYRVRGGGSYHPNHCGGGLGSRLQWDVVRAILSVIVVVDLQKVPDLTVGQVTDYATLIGLAQIRENSDPGPAPTILHLFSNAGEARPEGLSAWDESFLQALYSTNADAAVQISQIKVRLGHDLVR
jgi:hypothetical protein